MPIQQPTPHRPWRRDLAVAAVVVAALVAVAALAFWAILVPRLNPLRPGPLGPGFDRHVVAAIPVGQPGGRGLLLPVAAGGEGVWVLRPGVQELVRVDPHANRVDARVRLGLGAGWSPESLTTGNGAVWVLSVHRRSGKRTEVMIQRIDPATAAVAGSLRLPAERVEAPLTPVAGGGSLWLAGFADHVLRLDQATGTITAVALDSMSLSIAVADGTVWVATAGGLVRLDPTGKVTGKAENPNGSFAGSLAATASGLWALADGELLRIDPASGRVMATVHTQVFSATPVSLAAGEGVVAAVSDDGMGGQVVSLIDARSNRVRAKVGMPGSGELAVGAGAVWITDSFKGLLLRVDQRP